MKAIKHSLLKKLFIMQVSVALLGGIAILSSFVLSSILIAKRDLEGEKKSIESKVRVHLDEWTGWYELGMTELLNEEMNGFKLKHNLESLYFSHIDQVKTFKSIDSVILIKSLPSLFLVIHLKEQNFISVLQTQKNVVVSILILTLIFLLIAYISFIFLRGRVHLPITKLIESMRGSMENKLELSRKVEATDEMRVFVDEISSLFEKIRLMERTSALGMITAQVSHDLMSPIASLEILLENSSASNEEKELLKDSISRIRKIADDLLFKNRTVDLSAILIVNSLEEIIDIKRTEFSKSGVTIKCNIDAGVMKAKIKISNLDFQRTVSNLINNGIEAYVNKKGLIEIELSKEGEKISLSVKDYGCGMSKELLAKIGEYGQTFNKPQGSGLGLFGAKQLVNTLGGDFRVNSELGHGTKVTLSFPFEI